MQLAKATWEGQAMKRLAIWIFRTNLQGFPKDYVLVFLVKTKEQ